MRANPRARKLVAMARMAKRCKRMAVIPPVREASPRVATSVVDPPLIPMTAMVKSAYVTKAMSYP